MMKKTFENEILDHLKEQYRRYPAMEQQDIVKFVFQAMLGMGHICSSRDAAEEYITRETEQLAADAGGPMIESLSPDWCRFSLYSAKEKDISPSVVAGIMLSSGEPRQFTREDVFRFCTQLAASGEKRMTDPTSLGRILDETWLPSHSADYRDRYHPAYRVISAEWIPYMEAVERIAGKRTDRMLVTIDGPCASGKTTLAERLAGVFDAAVVHTDDFVIPHARKTAERLAVPGGNCDADQLAREVVVPWKQGGPVIYRRYDCRNDRLLPEEELPTCSMLILEGSYCNLPVIRAYADVRIFVNATLETREKRLRQRESARSLQMFYDRWIPLENHYFSAYGLPDPECVAVNTGDCPATGENRH